MKPHQSLYLRLVIVIGVIVPRRLRADWRQEWEAEIRSREALLAEWERLDWRGKLDLWRRSLGSLRDALLLQPQRLEDEMMQDLRIGWRALRSPHRAHCLDGVPPSPRRSRLLRPPLRPALLSCRRLAMTLARSSLISTHRR